MIKRILAFRFSIPLLVLAITLLASVVSFSLITVARKADAAGVFIPHPVFVNPTYSSAGQADAAGFFPCQSMTAAVHCFSPQQFQANYAIQPLLDSGVQGKGTTVVIIDAFQSITLNQDLTTFNSTFHLPDANLNVVAPDGIPAWNPQDTNMIGWGAEITLDVEWVHAIAPQAKIVLVEAKSNQDADILSATKYAITNNLGDVISQSFGEGESCADPAILRAEHALFVQATQEQITLVAAAGDTGSAQQSCNGSSFIFDASTPASDPLVTGIGGTEPLGNTVNNKGTQLTTNSYMPEAVWNETATGEGAGGGGFSKIYPRPDYQNQVSSAGGRGVPDVAINAAIDGGVLVNVSYLPTGKQGGPWHIFGGTSASCAEWAGLVALADQLAGHRLGQLNQALYQIGPDATSLDVFHDITAGNNAFIGPNAKGRMVSIPGFRAAPGWDPASGWGSPVAANLVPALVTTIAHQQ
jgi:subtilase family serine protease